MTASDLLRAAAEKLRQHANNATRPPWTRADVISICADLIDEVDAEYEYISLMHPPVALALAELLDSEAEAWEIYGSPRRGIVAVARAILREDES